MNIQEAEEYATAQFLEARTCIQRAACKQGDERHKLYAEARTCLDEVKRTITDYGIMLARLGTNEKEYKWLRTTAENRPPPTISKVNIFLRRDK